MKAEASTIEQQLKKAYQECVLRKGNLFLGIPQRRETCSTLR